MEIVQQIISKMSQITSILIISNSSNGDSVAASLALGSFLKKLDKEIVLLSLHPIPNQFNFLPQIEEFKEKIDLTKNFVVDISTKKSQLAELTYKKDQDKLSIYIKPKSGELTAADVSFRTSSFPYDLVILIGTSSPEHLGEFYTKHADLFFDVPLVNIDFRASNENYGQFNLVNLSATSCSEIIFDLINKFESSLLDEKIATQLLTGIIAETNSFQHVRTTPQTFLKASQLVSMGAKQQEIINSLYKTKSLGLLKLWGRVLARLKHDPETSLVYSAVNQNDLEKSTATVTDVDLIIREMAAQLNFAKIFLFFKEENAIETTVYISSNLPINLNSFLSFYKPESIAAQTLKFTTNLTVAEAEKQLVEQLKTYITNIRPTL